MKLVDPERWHAVLAMVLHQYVFEQAEQGHRVTLVAAQKLAAAIVPGTSPDRSVKPFDFEALKFTVVGDKIGPLPLDTLVAAEEYIGEIEAGDEAERLWRASRELTVAEMERLNFNVPGPRTIGRRKAAGERPRKRRSSGRPARRLAG